MGSFIVPLCWWGTSWDDFTNWGREGKKDEGKFKFKRCIKVLKYLHQLNNYELTFCNFWCNSDDFLFNLKQKKKEFIQKVFSEQKKIKGNLKVLKIGNIIVVFL